MTTYLLAAGAIADRFKTLVADVESIVTIYDNSGITPPDDAAFIVHTLLYGDQVQVSAGAPTANRYRVPGIMHCNIYTPLNVGDTEGLRLGGVIEAAFRTVSVGSSPVVHFRTPSVDPAGRSGDMWQTDVRAPFYFDRLL